MEEMERLLDPRAASEFLEATGVRASLNTLIDWRKRKVGPKYRKVQGRVYYEEKDLLEFTKGEER